MRTSYFAKYKERNAVSIAVTPPSWFKGGSYPDLSPTWEMVSKYRKTGNKREYVKSYRAQVLSRLDPQKVYDDLKDKVIICYEKSGEFCHRHIAANWIKSKLGIEVLEIQ